MSWRQGLALTLGLGLAVGCAGAPANAAAPAAAAPSLAPVPSAPPSVLPAASAAAELSTPAPVPVPVASATANAVSFAPICRAKCDELVAKCSKASVDSCRLNCSKYDAPQAECAAQVRAALECTRDAQDLTCANVAPESCSAKFKEIAACTAGEAPKPASPSGALPEGWETIRDAANGFSIALPSGSTAADSAEGPVRAVTAADGTTYTVSVLPLLKEKPSEKSLLHFLMKVQGRCSDKVKLDGFVEKEGRSSIHYSAHCPDKTDWDGMLYIGTQHLILLSARAATGKVGITEPFFYDFEFADH
jgi:hypothetical protein